MTTILFGIGKGWSEVESERMRLVTSNLGDYQIHRQRREESMDFHPKKKEGGD